MTLERLRTAATATLALAAALCLPLLAPPPFADLAAASAPATPPAPQDPTSNRSP